MLFYRLIIVLVAVSLISPAVFAGECYGNYYQGNRTNTSNVDVYSSRGYSDTLMRDKTRIKEGYASSSSNFDSAKSQARVINFEQGTNKVSPPTTKRGATRTAPPTTKRGVTKEAVPTSTTVINKQVSSKASPPTTKRGVTRSVAPTATSTVITKQVSSKTVPSTNNRSVTRSVVTKQVSSKASPPTTKRGVTRLVAPTATSTIAKKGATKSVAPAATPTVVKKGATNKNNSIVDVKKHTALFEGFYLGIYTQVSQTSISSSSKYEGDSLGKGAMIGFSSQVGYNFYVGSNWYILTDLFYNYNASNINMIDSLNAVSAKVKLNYQFGASVGVAYQIKRWAPYIKAGYVNTQLNTSFNDINLITNYGWVSKSRNHSGYNVSIGSMFLLAKRSVLDFSIGYNYIGSATPTIYDWTYNYKYNISAKIGYSLFI